MAFNALEYLEQGKVDFLYDLPFNSDKSLIKMIRSEPIDKREKIIDGCLPLLKNQMGRFCFDIMYNIPKYKEEAWEILHNSYVPSSLMKNQLINILFNTTYGKEYLEENFYELINCNINDLDFIFSFLFRNYEYFETRLKELAFNKDLHVRFLFMKYLVSYARDKVSIFYDNITKYFTSVTYQLYEQYTFLPEYMDVRDVSELAVTMLNKNDYEMFLKIKKFIFDNYDKNNLGELLTKPDKISVKRRITQIRTNARRDKELQSDVDNYFVSANSNKYHIYKNYSHLLSKELLEEYKKFLIHFKTDKEDIDSKISSIDYWGLSNKLEEYVDKYLSLCTTDESHFIGSGTTASTFKIGDYAIKLINGKWSYEDVICPNLYLIIPNLEEEYIRNKDGIIMAGIEVQKFIEKSAEDVPRKYFDLYKEELERLGYYTTDSLIDGKCGDNCRLYDNYLESNNSNPPEWYKKYPLVLVDRDRIYSLDNRRPKQLHESWY